MRTVAGRTDSVVVVGAGLAGLSTALRLTAAGRQVTVVERDAGPGGLAGRLDDGGYIFDTGPTVLTLPELVEDALGCVGERPADWLDLQRLDPAYRAFFPDGSRLDVHGDVAAMAAEVATVCGPREASGYLRFVDFVTDLYRLQMRDFVDRNLDSPRDLLTVSLLRLVMRGGFRRLAPKIGGFFNDPRLRRIFTFQSMYVGVSPYEALALYAVISYMDCVRGVYFPRGGMHALPVALAGAAEKHGVTFRFTTEVSHVDVRGGRATGVVTTDGERIPADAVVLTPDRAMAYAELLPPGRRRARRLRYSPSCFLLLAGSHASYAQTAHHNVHFGHSWGRSFRELDDGQLMSDPSLLVTNPTRTDPSLAPPGRATYYVLVPTPHLGADIDWTTTGPRYRDEIVATLERRGYVGFGAGIEAEHTVTPADWRTRGLTCGTPFAAAHTFGQTGPFRPGNLAPHLDNVVFAGAGTQPGVGVPMVLVSGRLAAERITGPAPGRRRAPAGPLPRT